LIEEVIAHDIEHTAQLLSWLGALEGR